MTEAGETYNVPVLIVGGGPVGLSLALALARQNVHSLVVEQHASIMPYPKARVVSMRSMELFRQWGILTELSKYERPKEARRFIWVESLQGKEIARSSYQDSHLKPYSPVLSGFITQGHVEQSLHGALKNYQETEVQFSKEMISFEQDDSGVNVRILNRLNNQEEMVRAQYLIAADGVSSRIRQKLEIKMEDEFPLGTYCSVYFEADLSAWTKNRPSFGFHFINPMLAGRILLAGEKDNRWLVFMRFLPENTKEDFTDEYCLSVLQQLINAPDLPITVLRKSFWAMGTGIASQYRKDRVFLVGDAAHCLPPTGTLGLNTGIQDAHSLAWRLALVLKHNISEKLLDTYYPERAPVAKRNIKYSSESADRHIIFTEAIRSGDMETLRAKIKEHGETIYYEGLDLGFIYHSNAVISETDQDLSVTYLKYIPTTLPGGRAPYVPLMKKGETISTLDLFERDFVLLVGADGQDWQKAAVDLAQSFPLKSYRVAKDGDLIDLENSWHEKYEISTSGAVLVRPDGHVAWRSRSMMDNPKATLQKVLNTILPRD